MEANFKTFCAAIIFGAGFKLGWGLIGAVLAFLAHAAGSDGAFLR